MSATRGGPAGEPLLSVRDLAVDFRTPRGRVSAVRGVSFDAREGETLGIIGASGSGKTTTALALLGLLPSRSARVGPGRAMWRGLDLLAASERTLRGIRGREIAMVYQDPLSALHPAFPVIEQVAEAVRAHADGREPDRARSRAFDLLRSVGLPPAALRPDALPHEWSGGMRQRALIAMALAHGPRLLVADEPTTALDVTVQAQILELLRETTRADRLAMILITHDLGVIAEMADRVAVMHEGRIVETGDVERLFAAPRHPRTVALLSACPGAGETRGRGFSCPPEGGGTAIPRGGRGPAARSGPASSVESGPEARTSLLRVEALTTIHPPARRGGAPVRAVDRVTFSVAAGETLGLVGESGCGKTTLARTLVGLTRPVAGRVFLGNEELTRSDGAGPLRYAGAPRRLQLVFQDPYASLNPRRRIGDSIAQPLRIHGLFEERGGRRRVAELLERVGLRASAARRYPHQLSGGQRQRVGIARALAVEPDLLILDEPVSSLDAPVRSRVLATLAELQRDLGIAYLLIAHDLSLAAEVSDRIAVMYLGRIVEIGPTRSIFGRPGHPYTRALLSAVPVADPRRRRIHERVVLEGEVPHGAEPPPGCPFHPRCWKAAPVCREREPELEPRGGSMASACFFLLDPRTEP